MRKIISFMHVSLDGFVAAPAGSLDWVKVDEELFEHVGRRIVKTDTAMYGRTTYEMMEAYWPDAGKKPDASRHDIEHSRWYGEVKKIVLSTTLAALGSDNTVIIGDNVGRHINKIKQQAGGEILLFGSPAATHSLMRLGLIDGFWLFVNPVILGQGTPLFTETPDRIKLVLLNTRQFSSGVTELDYIIA